MSYPADEAGVFLVYHCRYCSWRSEVIPMGLAKEGICRKQECRRYGLRFIRFKADELRDVNRRLTETKSKPIVADELKG